MKSFSHIIVLALLSAFVNHSIAEDTPTDQSVDKSVKIPGLVLDLNKKCIDLEATICLDDGLLELVACTKGSKEHESIVAVSARAMHIHTALLLLGANNGHPAMRKQVGREKKRWINVPPKGDEIRVFLITTSATGKQIERPISDFIIRSKLRVDEVDGTVIAAPNEAKKTAVTAKEQFSNTFLFVGSHLRKTGKGPPQYLADSSGNVISIATFGDELLCLPFHETQENNALMWRIKPKSLPKAGTQVILRLRPPMKTHQPKTIGKDAK